MRPAIGEVGPTVVFNAAFEGDQSVGPAFDRRRLSLLVPETWDASQSGYGCTCLCWTNRDLSWLHRARAGRAAECKSRLKAACAVTDRQQTAR